MINLFFYLMFSMTTSFVDYTDTTRPEFGGPIGATATDRSMVKAIDGNPAL